jgi:hypothetical protein
VTPRPSTEWDGESIVFCVIEHFEGVRSAWTRSVETEAERDRLESLGATLLHWCLFERPDRASLAPVVIVRNTEKPVVDQAIRKVTAKQ